MSTLDIYVGCPHCEYRQRVGIYVDDRGAHDVINGVECSKCEKLFGCEISVEVSIEGVWKEDEEGEMVIE